MKIELVALVDTPLDRKSLEKKLESRNVELPKDTFADGEETELDIEDGALEEFVERLEERKIAADCYLPVAFRGVFACDGVRVGSVHGLVKALQRIGDEDDLRTEEGDDEDEDAFAADDAEGIQRLLWRALRSATKVALERNLVLMLPRT